MRARGRGRNHRIPAGASQAIRQPRKVWQCIKDSELHDCPWASYLYTILGGAAGSAAVTSGRTLV